MNLFTKQTYRHIKQTVVAKGTVDTGGWLGSWGLAEANYYIIYKYG